MAVMGPTASGKTAIAEEIAERTGAQLIGADAFHVYQGFDVGTNKPPRPDRYKLIDIRGPEESFGVGEFVVLAAEELWRLWREGRSAVVVGGTGLYVRALFEEWKHMASLPDPELRARLEGDLQAEGVGALFERLRSLDPASAARTDPANPTRVRRALERALSPSPPIDFALPPFRRVKLGIGVDPDVLNTRIDDRAEQMLRSGWVGEVERLLAQGVSDNSPAMRAIGYGAVSQHCRGVMDQDTMLASVRNDTRRYAKRQRTWLRTEPGLVWLDADAVGAPLGHDALDVLIGRS